MNPIANIFQYGFMIHAFEAGLAIALVAPLIGMFLVLRRYSLIADTFAHVSLLGVALGFLLGLNPVLTALTTTVISAFGIERLRTTKRVYGESALSLFLSGSLALATVILSASKGFNSNLFNYLFGSIVTVTGIDVLMIALLAILSSVVILALYKKLVFISFDEEAARAAGIPARGINLILIILAAVVIALSIPILGVLLIAALMIIPVLAALQLHLGFGRTLLWAEVISVFSVLSGITASFYLNLSTGGTIVLIMLAIFLLLSVLAEKK